MSIKCHRNTHAYDVCKCIYTYIYICAYMNISIMYMDAYTYANIKVQELYIQD